MSGRARRVSPSPPPRVFRGRYIWWYGDLEEAQREAARQGRSLAVVMQEVWRIARSKIRCYPAASDTPARAEARRLFAEERG